MHQQKTRIRAWGHISLLIMALNLFALLGCEGREVTYLEVATAGDEAAAQVISTTLKTSYFDALSGTPSEEIEAAMSLQWQGDLIEIDAPDASSVSLGPLDQSLIPQQLTFSGDENLSLLIEYHAPPSEAAIRINQGAETTICSLVVDLGPRVMHLSLSPVIEEGIATWEVGLLAALDPMDAQVLDYTLSKECDYDLESLDWLALSERVDSVLSSRADAAFSGHIAQVLDEALPLFKGGLLFKQGDPEFFAPLDMRLAMRAAREGAFSMEDGEVWLSVDAETKGNQAACVEGLDFRLPDARPVSISPENLRPSSGAPFNLALAIDDGFLHKIIGQLTLSGHLCGDLDFGRGLLPALDSPNLFPELTRSEDLSFGTKGRVRIQPLGAPQLVNNGGNQLQITSLPIRLEVYGTVRDILVNVAQIEADLKLDLRLEITGSLLRLSLDSFDAEILSEDLSLLTTNGIELEADQVLERLTQLALEELEVPLPTTFGRPLELVEIEPVGTAWVFFLKLGE